MWETHGQSETHGWGGSSLVGNGEVVELLVGVLFIVVVMVVVIVFSRLMALLLYSPKRNNTTTTSPSLLLSPSGEGSR